MANERRREARRGALTEKRHPGKIICTQMKRASPRRKPQEEKPRMTAPLPSGDSAAAPQPIVQGSPSLHAIPSGVFAETVTEVQHYTDRLFRFRTTRPAWVDLDGALLVANDPFEGPTFVDGRVLPADRPGIGVAPRSATP